MSILTFARISIRLAVGVVLVLHGLAHAPGVLASWGLASYENVSYQPNILLETASDGVVRLLGAVWLMAGAAFVFAGISILRQAPWWRPATLVACLLSLTVSTLWLEDAIVGLVINLGVLALLAGLWAGLAWQSTRKQTPQRGVTSPA